MAFVLENEYLKLECVEKAGEIQHLFDKEKNLEIMYQGDQAWSGKNPTLFPIVGNTWTENYQIDGKTYAMKNHGLIRYANLKGEQNEDSLVFTLDANEDTLAQYPFNFHYEMKYSLEGKVLHIDYLIKNTSDVVMPFTFGLHPAFRCPQNDGEKFEDYSIAFEKHEVAKQRIITEQPSYLVDVEMDEWKLSREDLSKYLTVIYSELKSDYVTLNYKGEPRVKVTMEDFPLLALWSIATPSDFICIEPWYGHADFEAGHDDFFKREGTMLLEPNEVFTTSYTIEAL